MANMDHNRGAGQSTGVLDQDVGCPGCGYNLRGLGSDHVVCPECGLHSDVGQLLLRRWDKPWYRAPKFNTICMPAAVFFVTSLAWMVSEGILSDSFYMRSPRIGHVLLFLGGFIGWVLALSWVWHKLDGPVSVGFALLAHVPVIGYLWSIGLLFAGLAVTAISAADYSFGHKSADLESVLRGICMVIAAVGLFFLSRWIERYVAGHCIRVYLRRPTSGW